MKKSPLHTIIVALFVTTAISGQNDTIFTTITQETGTMEPQQFISEYGRAFSVMTPAKWMFKIDLGSTFADIATELALNLAVETKLSNSFSVGLNYESSRERRPGDEGWGLTNPKKRLSTTARWYYNMGKKIRQGKSASNFSGNYLAFESALLTEKKAGIFFRKYDFISRFGIQRRLLGNSYFDVSYGIGVVYEPDPKRYGPKGNRALSLRPRTALGLGFFRPRRKETPTVNACDLTKCYEEGRSMLKIDLNNLMQSGQISKKNTFVWVNPSIVYEHKIGASPFSVELGVSGQATYAKTRYAVTSDIPSTLDKKITGTASAELRWYHSQKKNILKGISGNNLSGDFYALNVARTASRYRFAEGAVRKEGDLTTSAVMLVYGWQFRFLKHGFMQCKLGGGPSLTKETIVLENGGHQTSDEGLQFLSISEFKVGLAF